MRPLILIVLLASCSPRAALWTGAESPRSTAELAVRATVALREGMARWPQVAGCGVLISRREILTAGHAVKSGGQLELELADGSRRRAAVVKSLGGPAATRGPMDAPVARDLALLRLVEGEGGSSSWLPIGEDPALGEQVLVVGAPEGYAGVLASGPVGRIRGVDALVIGAHVEPGWSGGPVVSRAGELVGLVVRGRESAALAVPASEIRSALKELRQ